MPALTCSRCGAANDGDVRFCGRCGAPLQPAEGQPAPLAQAPVPCPSCGTPNAPSARFCGVCGKDLSQPATATPAVGAAGAAQSAAAAAGLATRRCPSCGMENAASARFCGRCSTPLPMVGDAAAPAAMACPRCGTANAPGARFCGACGLTFAGPAGVTAQAIPAPAFQRASQAQVWGGTPHKTRQGRPWALIAATFGVAMAVLAIVSRLIVPGSSPVCRFGCPPGPPKPLAPAGPPLAQPEPTYTSSALGFSVAYLPNLAPQTDAQSALWQLQNGSGVQFTIEIQGEAANGRTPQQLVDALQQKIANGATLVYNITGAELGYMSGYGNVYDLHASPAGGQAEEDRYIVEAAVQNGVAVELWAESILTQDTSDHPSPAELLPDAEYLSDTFGNTVLWQGEKPI